MKKIFVSLLLCFSPFLSFASSLTSTPLSFGVSPSGLNVSSTPSVISGFSELTLDGTTQVKSASLSPITISDFTGTGSGWNLSASASTFTNGSSILFSGLLHLQKPFSVTSSSGGTPPMIAMIAPSSIDGSSVLVVSASANDGMGLWLVNFPLSTLTFTAPPTIHSGTYTSTITWTLSVGP